MTRHLLIQPLDIWGWHHITWGGKTLQAFRTEGECRQWLADTYRIRRAMGII